VRKLSISIAAIAALAFMAGSANAQCLFDDAPKAKGMKTSMVRSFVGCSGSITYAAPNSQTGTGVPTCAPPLPHSAFVFDNKKGSCSFQTKGKLEVPCSDGSGDDCYNLSLQAKCAGINEPDTVTPISSGGWSLSTVTRATLDDADNGDMTVINFPIQVAFPQASKGKIQLKTDSNEILAGLGLASLPPCASIELLTLKIKDPSGNPFATLGSGGRPKGS